MALASTLGTTMEANAMTDLPLNVSGGRDASVLLYSTVPTMTGGYYLDHIAGSPSFSKTIMIDGTDGNNGMQGFVFAPGMDAIQEMQAQTGSIGVEGSGTGGGVIMYEIKSGTNQFHGSAFYFLHNEIFDANTWESNFFRAQCASGDTSCKQTYKRAPDRLNDYGFSAGGPIWKKHTFIFGDYERYVQKNLEQTPLGTNVPTAKMLTGDFSQLLTNGFYSGQIAYFNAQNQVVYATDPCDNNSPVMVGEIFDPTTWNPALGCGKPFAGNLIPSGRLSTISKGLASIFQQDYAPSPFAPTGPGSLTQFNYPTMVSSSPWTNRTAVDLKLDQIFSDKHHLSTSFDYLSIPVRNVPAGGLFDLKANGGPFSSASHQSQVDRIFRVIDTYALTPNLLNSLTFSMAQNFVHDDPDTRVNPSTYGFTNDANSINFPNISYWGSNSVSLSAIGTSTEDVYALNGFHYGDKLQWVKGRHHFSFGGEFTALQNNSNYGGNVQSYVFDTREGNSGDNASLYNYSGFGFANFMLGDVQSAGQNIPYATYNRRKVFDMYVQDQMKVNSKLTLTMGLRWDVTLPEHEKFGHWTNWDTSLVNPSGIWGNYAGAWAFAGSGNATFEKYEDYHQFGPHIGAAYQVTNKLVARAGFGLFYVPIGMNERDNHNYASPDEQNYFYSPVNQVTNLLPGTYDFNWDSKAYPGTSQNLQTNSSESLALLNGQWPWTIDPNSLHLGTTKNWNAGVQYQLTKDMVLNVDYSGNIGRNLHDGALLAYQNYPSFGAYQSLWNSGHVNDWVSDPTSAHNAGIAYPYTGFAGDAWTAIGPYPQVASAGWALVVNSEAPVGSSAYNALIAEVVSRHSNGLTMDLSYTLSKATGNVALDSNLQNTGGTYWYQDQADYQATGNVLSYDTRHIVKGYATYDLPFGAHQRWGGGARNLNYLIGGWTVGFQPAYTSGQPLLGPGTGYALIYPGWMGLRANLAPGAKLGNTFKKLNPLNLTAAGGQFFNPANFTAPTNGTLGSSPFIFNHWRGWASVNENLSAIKHFSFGHDGRYTGSIRADFYDVFNRHQWGEPDVGSLSDAAFGYVTSVSGNRTGQIQARFAW
jgi:hypothetical protein